ncbi:cation:proton antiporter [Olleya sp. AH-315-K02]|nr:cation:proton antiporter [Olleya sp. AH-315-K02]
MHLPILQDIIILLSFSVVVVFFLQRFKIPSILGFLITGVLIGPFGLGLISAVNDIEIIAEIGVILLLFVIGMELSLKQLVTMRKTVLIGGFIQVSVSVLLATTIYHFLDFSWTESVFIGFLFSLSSTAIVLKILQDRNEISEPHGRNVLGILIFQDIIVVPMMLVTPIMAGQDGNVGIELLTLLVKTVLLIVFTYISARYIVPRLLLLVVRTKNKELFLLTTISLCFTVTFLTYEAGLSLALGAFIAGLIISESEYGHQATGTIVPFKVLFTSIFFISIGMLLNLDFLFKNIVVILSLVIFVFFSKAMIASLAVAVLKYPPRVIILTGLALFQIGEFSFILSKVGVKYDILSFETNQYFLSVSIITMLLTPFVIQYADNIASMILKVLFGKKYKRSLSELGAESKDISKLKNHLVIIGYGINGVNLARVANHADIPYIIIESDVDIVKREKQNGKAIMLGDATDEFSLNRACIENARVVVIAISNSRATKQIISSIRTISKSVHLIIRTQYIERIDTYIELGADEVISEKFETSIEIFSRVLHNYLIPVHRLDNLINIIRADNYNSLQTEKKISALMGRTQLPEFNIVSVHLLADSGKIVGKTIIEADIRKSFGVSILAIFRNEEMINTITPDQKLIQNDIVYISGDQEHIEFFFNAVT